MMGERKRGEMWKDESPLRDVACATNDYVNYQRPLQCRPVYTSLERLSRQNNFSQPVEVTAEASPPNPLKHRHHAYIRHQQ